MSGVYLTLHQGATDVIQQFGRTKGREALNQRAIELRRYVQPLGPYGFRWDAPIDLRAQQALARDYEYATVAHQFYTAGQVPSDADLIDDLDALLEVYQTIVTDRIGTAKTNTAPAKWWIFQVNPALFDVSAALDELTEITFEVNQHAEDIHAGDHVFLWVSGKEGGVIAFATVLTEPQQMQMREAEISFAVDQQRFSGTSLRVPIHIERRATSVLPRSALKQDPRLEGLSILRFSQGTNFPMTAEQAAIVLDLLKSSSAPAPSTEHVWLFAPGRDAELWDELYREGILAIGWDDMGDLSQYTDIDALTTRMKEVYESDQEPRNNALACFEFSHVMRAGDLVLAKQGRDTVLGYGVVTGDYRFDDTRSSYKHVRSIRWDGRGKWRAPSKFVIKTLTDISPYPDLVKQLNDLVRGRREQNPIVETIDQKCRPALKSRILGRAVDLQHLNPGQLALHCI